MLVEKAQSFIKLVEITQRMGSEKDLLMQFRTRSSSLQDLVRSLNEVCNSYYVMKKAGIKCPNFNEALESTLTITNTKTKLFLEKPEWLLDTTEFQSFHRIIKNSIEQVRKRLLEIWLQYIREIRPFIQEETLSIISKISSFQHDIEIMRSNLNTIDSISKRLPDSEHVMDQLKKSIDELNLMWAKFGQGNIPMDVLSFLKQAGSLNGAPIHLCTASVMNWLNEHDILKYCTVRI